MADSSKAERQRQALVIDDSRTMRRIACELLRSLSFEVTEAENGRVGLDRLRELSTRTLVLVDWNMPEMDGLEFIRAVRGDRSYDDVLLMMVTTEVDMQRVQQALSAGANEYLMKPFTSEMVVDKLSLLGVLEAAE